MKNIQLIVLNLFILTACGSESSEDMYNDPSAVQLNQITSEDLDSQQRRCIDDHIPLLDAALDSCIALGILGETICQNHYDTQVAQLGIIWNSIRAAALADYNSCMANPLTSGLLGPDFCRAEFYKVVEQRIGECDGRELLI